MQFIFRCFLRSLLCCILKLLAGKFCGNADLYLHFYQLYFYLQFRQQCQQVTEGKPYCGGVIVRMNTDNGRWRYVFAAKDLRQAASRKLPKIWRKLGVHAIIIA